MGGGTPLKVLHIITDLDTGGAEMMLYKLLNTWKSEPLIENVVITLMGRGPITERIESLGVTVQSLGMEQGERPTIGKLRTLIHKIEAEQPSLIQGWMYHGNIAATAAVFLLRGFLRLRQKIPVVWNIRQTLYDLANEKRMTRMLIGLGRLCSRLPAGIIYNSTLSAEQHEKAGFNAKNRVMIPNGFDLQRFQPNDSAADLLKEQFGLAKEALLVGHISRWHPMKGHATLLQAARRVVDGLGEDYPVHFLLVGRGVTDQQEALVQSIDALGLTGHVLLLGERSDVEQIMAAVDLVVSPSSWGEGFPNVIGEAMACGAPCLVTDVGDSTVIVKDTGKVVPINDDKAMADGIISMLVQQETLQQLGQQARDRVMQHYSIDAVANRYLELYRKLIF